MTGRGCKRQAPISVPPDMFMMGHPPPPTFSKYHM